MVRKQLYIEQDQEQALKARVQELGITEAQFVRQALDRALEQTLPSYPLSSKSHLSCHDNPLEKITFLFCQLLF